MPPHFDIISEDDEDRTPINEEEEEGTSITATTTTTTTTNRTGRSRASSSTSGIGSIDSKEVIMMDQENSSNRYKMDCYDRPNSRQGNNNGHVVTDLRRFVPPDGGIRAWMVMISSFLCNGIIFGITNSFGVVFVFLKEEMKEDPSAAAKASLVGALTIGATFLLSPVSGILADKFGIRKTALFGGILATTGMFLSSFSVHRFEVLCFTYGIMFGCGSSLCYTPSLVILGHYFRRRMGLVNGIVTAGSSLFTMAMPFILDGLLTSVGLSSTLLFLSGLTSLLIVASFSFKSLMPKEMLRQEHEHDRGCLSKIVKVENWRNTKYVIWAVAIPSALFGYFVPYVHIVQYVKDILPESNGRSLVTCIGITSGLGRIVFGIIADWPRVNRILLQQISFYAIGTCTMFLVAAPHFTGFEFPSLIIISLIMGIFDGCFITMLGPIAFDICGPAGASQAIGFLLGMCSIPLTLGPPIAGWMYDSLGNYTAAFLAAGCPPIIGATLMCLIYLVKSPEDNNEEEMDNNVDDNNVMKRNNNDEENETGEDPSSPKAMPSENTHMLRTAATAITIVSQEDQEEIIKYNRDVV